MEFITTINNNFAVIMPKGRIDTSTALEFDNKIKNVIDKGIIKVIIDFSHTDFISSAGVRILHIRIKEIKNLKGKVGLSNMLEPVEEVFEVSGFATIFNIYKSMDEAIKFLSD